MKQILTRFILLVCCTMIGQQLWAQTTVSGRVTDADTGEPLVGATVKIAGATADVKTDGRGGYSIIVPSSNTRLMISFIGYRSQELEIGNNEMVNVALVSEDAALDEVVVIGYGTQSRRNVTGSVSKVDIKATENLPNTNVTQALRGRVAGVQFTDSGRPGQNGSILIRGPRSLSGGNNPLIILDGIFFNGTIATINPNDIESMEILKDASAAAIYGSRAANGVILITSKRGTTEKPTIGFNSYFGVSDWSYQPILLTADRYLQKTLDARKQNGMEADPDNVGQYLTTSESDNYANGIVTNPWDMISQSGRIQSYDLNLSGNTKYTNYFLSGSYFNENGIIYQDDQRRLSLRANIEGRVGKYITIGTNSIFTSRDLSGVHPSISSAITASPYGNWFHDDGEPTQFYVIEDGFQTNALRAPKLTTDEDIYENLSANFYMNLELPFIAGLSYRINYSPNYRWERNYRFERQDTHVLDVNNREARKFNRLAFDWVLENILKYEKSIGDDHQFDLTLLYGANKFSWDNTEAKAQFLPNDQVKWNNLSLGELLTNNSDAASTQGVSSMVRLNYNFKDKYLFTFTARRDGSSVFGVDNKYATFPSAAFAWIASDESFLKDHTFVDLLKLRLSYGAVGNQAISPYQSLARVGSALYVFGDGSPYSIGSIPLSMANSQLKWETTYSTNFAVDFGFLKSRLNGTIEFYNLNTENLLISRALPQTTGFISTLANLGATNNKGIEVSLNTVNIQKSHFQWQTDLVFSHNRNKIVSLYGIDDDGDGREDDDVGNGWFIGHPIDVAYDYVFDGIYQVGDDGTPGDVRLKDLDGDGEVEPNSDRTVLGQTGQPKYRWGVTNTFRYKGLSLSVFINAMQGWTKSVSYWRSVLRPQNMFDYEWWTEENRSNSSPSLTYQNPLGHGYYYSRDFIRIQDVSLRYDFNNSLKALSELGLRNLGVWVSGKNLATFTDWPGMDPENGNSYDSFPMPRIFSAGVSVSF
ncbi:SusC/RagA family TonB-linked outer membrane protein [Parapedobacter sp. 2B3]|uniref:SusC/RagA family TonB-linked outer membrane protein n=1 Tax=Parapedobacter sp. 2B3 TaxID=3342381 RepID=UPI0035B632D2